MTQPTLRRYCRRMAFVDEILLLEEISFVSGLPMHSCLNFREQPYLMTRDEFIFSNKSGPRLLRHAAFWIVFVLYIFLLRFYVKTVPEMTQLPTYLKQLKTILSFFPFSFFYAYFALYYLLPNFILTGRYTTLFLIAASIAAVGFAFSYLATYFFDTLNTFDMPASRNELLKKLDFAAYNAIVLPLTVTGFGIGIKIAKNWQLKQQENEELARQRVKKEVQLMKTQIHPRFLFHSLNNIHSNLVAGSDKSPGMLLKLSDLLSYILYESDTELIALDKELTTIYDYISLEQNGKGQLLDTVIENKADVSGKYIAPLILLPLLEFCFEKNIADEYAGKSLCISIDSKDDFFYFSTRLQGFMANRYEELIENCGLQQVKRRLENLYPGNHVFEISMVVPGTFVVSLQLLLENKATQDVPVAQLKPVTA